MNFKKIIKHWQKEGLIDTEQEQKMLADLEKQSAKKRGFYLISIISTIGGLLLGLGAILLISSNWEYLGKPFKLFLALILPIIPILLAYWLIFKKNTHHFLGYAMALLGALLIGASIALVGQIYNTEANPQGLLLTWIVLALPLIYIFISRAIAILTVALFLLYIGYYLTNLAEKNNIEELIISIFPFVYIIFGIILFLIGSTHKKYLLPTYHKIGQIYQTLAPRIIVIPAFILTLGIFNKYLVDKDYALFGDASRFIYNILFIILLGLFYYYGSKLKNYSLINSAFIWTGVFVTFKYFDLFWEMFEVGLFFILGGALLIALSIFLYKKRKQFINNL